MNAVEIVVTGPETETRECVEYLLESRTVACAQISTIHSRYWWDGELEAAGEVRIAMHTRAVNVHAAIDFIEDSHPYETPCIIATRLDHVAHNYIEWIFGNTLAH